MNRVVADPGWHGYIIWYFYLGGIAAGAYAIASMAALFGDEEDRRGTRAAYYVAFPLVALCGVLLILDLGRPERFWHMMIQSETGRPMFKWWSPMSAGSWGLSAFGAFSFASFLGVLAEDGRLGLGRWASLARRLGRGFLGRAFEVCGTLSAFFLGAYTGTLLSATNQPFWADTTWLSTLFLASSASTGVALLIVLNRWWLRDARPEVEHRLESVDRWAIALEVVGLAGFAISLDGLAREAFLTWPGLLIPLAVVPLGIVGPWLLLARGPRGRAAVAATLVLLAGFALRLSVVGLPSAVIASGAH